MGLSTAVNPETGETAVFVDNKWVKASSVATNDKGEKAYLVNNQWLTDSAQKPPEPTQTGLQRSAGLAVRAAGPVAAGAAAGAAMGAPLAGVGAVPGALAGAGAMSIVKLLDSVAGTDYLGQIMDRIGLPRPETAGERVSSDVMGAVAGVPGAAGVGNVMAQSARPVVQRIGQVLGDNLGMQAASAVTGATAAGTTRELGGGPTAQFVAGLAGGVLPQVAQQVVKAVPNMVGRSIQKSEQTPFAREGERLAQTTGIDLPIGPRTGNKTMLTMENAARQYPLTADRAQEVDVKIANQAIDRVKALASRISANTDDAEQIGTRVQQTVSDAVTRLDAVRTAKANRDYGIVRQLAGDEPIVNLKNFTDELKNIISQYENVAGSDAQKVVSQARAALAKTSGVIEEGVASRVIETPTGKNITLRGKPDVTGPATATINDAMKSRSFYGKAAKGSANVFEDVAPDTNRSLAGRLFGAISKDFEESAANQGGDLKKAFDAANTNFRKFSDSINYLEKSALGKLVGEEIADSALSGNTTRTVAGETVFKKIQGLEPSTRRTAMEIINRWNPQLGGDIRAGFLRSALDEGMAIPPSEKGAAQVPISFNKFVAALGSQKVSFEKNLASYGFTKQEIGDIRDTAVAMMRAGDKVGYNYSNTNVAKDAGEIAGALGNAAAQGATGDAVGVVKSLGGAAIRIGGKVIGFNRIIDSMATAEGRAAIRTIVAPKASPQAVIAAFQVVEGK